MRIEQKLEAIGYQLQQDIDCLVVAEAQIDDPLLVNDIRLYRHALECALWYWQNYRYDPPFVDMEHLASFAWDNARDKPFMFGVGEAEHFSAINTVLASQPSPKSLN